MMTGIWNEVRVAIRGLVRNPGFALTTATTVALGIGAVTAIFTVLNGVVLEPLPFDDPDELVLVQNRAPGWGYENFSVSLSQYVTYQAENHTFEGLGAFGRGRASITGDGDAERVPSLEASWELFTVLGVSPALGRLHVGADDRPDAPTTVVISYGFWQSRFGADPDVIGSTLRIEGIPYTVIGVLPRDFDMPGLVPAIVRPIRLPREGRFRGYSYDLIGRLAPDVPLDEAVADLDRMIPIAAERYGGPTPSELRALGFAANVRPLKEEYVGDVARTLWILMGSVLVVLLIAWANAANLSLVRMEGRQREVAVRSALGAGGAQLLRYFLLEGLLLASVGGLIGVALAAVGVRSLLALGPGSIPRLGEIAVDAPVITLAVGMAAASGFVLALVPMLRVRSRGVVASMRGLRGASGGALQHRVRSALVVTQVSLALVLLVGSGLMLRSFGALLNVDPGVADPEQVVTFRVTVPENEIGDMAGVARTYEELAARFGELGGVESVGVSSSLTMEGVAYDEPIQLEDEPRRPDEEPIRVRTKNVGGGYFETMGIPVVAGRAIDWTDVQGGAPIVVVTRGFAEQHWGAAESALGRRIARGVMESTLGSLARGPEWREVAGVVEDVRDDGLDRPPPDVAYWPLPSSGFFVPSEMSLAVRTSRPSPTTLHSEIRAAAAEVNPNLPISAEGTLDGLFATSMSRTTFTLFALLVAGAVALSLGVVGLYGVVSYAVSRRTREIGVRIALGADSGDVSSMVVTQGATLAGIGVAIGLVAAAALTRLMASLLYGVEPTDPATFATVGALLMSVAIAASYMPARRAARMDPLEALRAE
jgi:putative ABC transport system permease protein